ncbi:AfsA-related hotdog domain-containing protein [Rhodococcus sp. IEGM 1381]|nr:AfsA-related hotdog domain-containing protein [Rhodococcus sp. IEGM 1381]MDI9894487.1 AfsA-related hotdog domain-containing protein [Rhodococcus sp. IEGM 1381]
MTGTTTELQHNSIQRLVHKRRSEAVLIESWQRAQTEHRYDLNMDWSPERITAYVSDAEINVVVAAESVRQAALLVSHAAYLVPRGSAFVMSTIRARVAPATIDQLRDNTFSARELIASVHCTALEYRGRSLDSMTVFLRVSTREGAVVADGSGRLRVLPEIVYRKIRGTNVAIAHRSLGRRLPPELVGCAQAQDVLLGDSPNGVRLLVDTDHPRYFDHPSDHIPGMVVIEACRQQFVRQTGSEPTSLSADFHSFVEYPADTLIETSLGDIRTIQDGREAVRVSFAA